MRPQSNSLTTRLSCRRAVDSFVSPKDYQVARPSEHSRCLT